MVQYIRNKKRQRVGVMVAVEDKIENRIMIGFSKCNMPLDCFDKYQGRNIAIGRAITWDAVHRNYKIPHSIIEPLKGFIARCKLYYKDKDFSPWVERFVQKEIARGE
jgi:hypothetical protein